MTESVAGARGERKAALSRDLSEFLIELSIAVHRYAMYPGDHPSLVPASENVIQGLSTLFGKRDRLSIGVAQRQLVIEGVATDERHPVLSDLARRLHAHQLGAVTFRRGATLREVQELLRTLSADPQRGGEAIGLLSEAERPGWTHIELLPVGYDQLAMKEGGGSGDGAGEGSRASYLWLGLAQAALGKQEVDPDSEATGSALARVLERRAKEEGYDDVIVDYLRQLAEELRDEEGEEAEKVRRGVSELVDEMGPEALRTMMEMGGSFAQRKKFLLDASKGLPVDAVMQILDATAKASDREISSSLVRMLTKLAQHAGSGARRLRAQADTALKEHVERLVSDWELEDPNPDQYTRVLDTLASSVPSLAETAGEEGEEGVAGAVRVLQMALEVDAYGPTLDKAVSDLVDAGQVGGVLQMLDSASEGNRVASRLRKQLTTPQQLRRLLSGVDVDEESLQALVDRMGPAAIDTLFELLTESESRAVRRKIFNALARMGPEVASPAMERLKDSRWYVQRNVLALLQRLEELPDGFDPMQYVDHSDSRVRREAYPLALKVPEAKARALARALSDSDERIVRMALLELQEGTVEALVPTIVSRVLRSDAFPGLRSLAVRSLRRARSSLALEALLEVCDGGRSLLGRRKLASKTPELVAALGILAEEWGEDPRARTFLELARSSGDLQIQAAASRSATPGSTESV